MARPVTTCACGGACPRCQAALQRKASSETDTALDADTAARAAQHDGAPLAKVLREYFEPRIGHDLSAVRVHSGSDADSGAHAVQARAYTLGRDIVFGAGEYTPDTRDGQRLLAHELAHVIQQGATSAPDTAAQTIARAPQPTAPSVQDYRDFVQGTIAQFNSAASYYGDALVKVNAALFDKLIDSWYSMVVDRQKMIKDQLSGDVLLDRDLQAAYIAAIRVLMTKAATALGKTENELYGTNSGRIPLWAWQSPHRQESPISTPLDQGQAVDPLSGNVGFTTPTGIAVTILPDAVDASQSTPVTALNLPFSVPFTTKTVNKVERIDTFTPPAPAATIQTLYPPSVSPSGTSGYGRGTTPEDIAGAKVDPQSTSLRWHEGNHGLDFQEFLKANPLPAFTGSKGQTRRQFLDAIDAYKLALKAYVGRATKASSKLTHCAGTTIDQYNQAQAAAGATVTLECTP